MFGREYVFILLFFLCASSAVSAFQATEVIKLMQNKREAPWVCLKQISTVSRNGSSGYTEWPHHFQWSVVGSVVSLLAQNPGLKHGQLILKS